MRAAIPPVVKTTGFLAAIFIEPHSQNEQRHRCIIVVICVIRTICRKQINQDGKEQQPSFLSLRLPEMPEAEKDIEKEPQDISHKACIHIHADIFIMESILDHLVAHSYAPFLVAESDPFPHVERRQGELPVQIGLTLHTTKVVGFLLQPLLRS